LSIVESARQRVLPVLFATARTPRVIRKIPSHDHLGLTVCANGAVVWDAGSDEVIEEHSFPGEHLVTAVANLRRTLPGAAVALLSAQKMFVDDAYVALRSKGATGAAVMTYLDDVVSANRIVVASVRHPVQGAEQLIDSITRAFDGVGVASFAGRSTIDVAPLGFTKAATVESLLDRVGCRMRQAIAFGDMPNDLGLFAASGWACAVATAHASVLAAADEVVPSNDDDGVALTVQRIFNL
jgi:hydroxymethylpyrimidine pyrophosphatase-like HAD family hydrolase